MGFDTLMTAGPDTVSEALALARGANLDLLLLLSLDKPVAGSNLAKDHPEWFQQDSDIHGTLPDPRKPGAAADSLAMQLHCPQTASAAADWWIECLSSWVRQGVGGFALYLDGPASPEFFREVISSVRAAHPHCRFLAWSPGISADRCVALSTCGFDGAFTSSAWWDFKSSWLAEEAARLAPFNCLIATVGRPGQRNAPSQSVQHEQFLWLAAATGEGLMVTGEWAGAAPPDVMKKVFKWMGAGLPAQGHRRTWRLLSPPGSVVPVLVSNASPNTPAWVMVTNTGGVDTSVHILAVLAKEDGLTLEGEVAASGGDLSVCAAVHSPVLRLAPHATWVRAVRKLRPLATAPKDSRRLAEASAKQAARQARIAIEKVTPSVDDGRFSVKRCVGDTLLVEADIFGEGHDLIAAALQWRAINEAIWHEAQMRSVVNDRWRAEFLLSGIGTFEYRIEAWIDVFGAYRDEIQKKSDAGQNIAVELREGVLLLEAAVAQAQSAGLKDTAQVLKRRAMDVTAERSQTIQVQMLLSPELHRFMVDADPRAFKVQSEALAVDSERRAAGFSSWYELFPRSMGTNASTHGTFADVMPRLPAIRAMGFDTLYFPPIHPIGLKHRKGRNNTLDAGEHDPGSPYAIGAPDGGHDAIHSGLGTLDDFRQLQRTALEHGLELALDFAIQCSPDHPWLKAHPDWFSWRPDGTIRYAENPPKKYQDIVNVDFYASGAVPRLWVALRDVVIFWVKEGVKVFRVDNPHTKPMPFWEWLIKDVRSRNPEVIFLAEAFTRPKPMYRLAKLGFSQSYTYFTWRHTKQEFIDYLTELTQATPRDFFRPHFFVNTPDINPYFLQRSGRAGFVIRAALAATLSGLWGMYSGFELCEAAPVPGKEEYLDSEKYELRQRDWTQPGNIVREITLLNQIRQSNPALHTHLGIRFCKSSGEDVLCFTKTSSGNVLLVAICLDPHAGHEFNFELPLEDWSLPEDACILCEDLVHGASGDMFSLHGRHQRLRLNPADIAFSIWRLKLPGLGNGR